MLHANGVSISLDRKEKGAMVDFISHAHSDHIASARSSSAVLASTETAALLKTTQGVEPALTAVPKGMRLIDAGHILGSKQLVVEDEGAGRKIVYTGDFMLQRSRACSPINVESADTVIVDSTYCTPGIEFPDRGDIESAMQTWTESKLNSGIVLFGVYALGKAQEVIAVLNEHSILPIVSNKISMVNRVYCENGVRLEYTSAIDHTDDYNTLLKGNFVMVVENSLMRPMATALSELCRKRVYTAVATGWALTGSFGTDVQFPLSDHADFSQCLEYINACGAGKVLSYGSNRLELAHALVERGYDAAPM